MLSHDQSQQFPGRTFYHASGSVRLGTLLFWLVPAFALATLLAPALLWLFLSGYYYFFIVPAVAGLGVGALVRLAMTKAHCRNWLVGGIAGFCAGAVLYIGYFYCGMVYHWGLPAASHPALLPVYIQARMKTDVIRDSHESKQSAIRNRSVGMNWYLFGLDATAVLMVTIMPAYQRSRRPYCETCGRWMTRRITSFNPNVAASLMDSLRNNSAQSLAALCGTPAYTSVPNVSLGIDICPSLEEGLSRGCPVYVSVKQVVQASGLADPIDQAKGKLLLRSLQANSSELMALGPRFKILDAAGGRVPLSEAREASKTGLQQENVEISQVEPEYAGKVLSRSTLWKGTALSLAPLLALLGGLILFVWGTITLLPRAASSLDKFAAYGTMAIGLVGFVAGLIVGMRNPSVLGNRYLLKYLRRELARRPKPIVDGDNPAAIFVEIVPKTNWGKIMLDTASDVGFLLLDRAKREILFEGDRKRFRISVDAIAYCGLEEFVQGQGSSAVRYYFVVLRVESSTQFWEAPIRPRTGAGSLGAGKRRKETKALVDSIQQMRSQPAGGVQAHTV